MKPEQIITSDLLDILFADRNKSYGAYALRREYNRRLHKALLITGALVCSALAFYYYQGTSTMNVGKPIIINLTPPIPAPTYNEPKPPTPPPPPAPKQQVSMRQFVTPMITKQATQPLPAIEDLINSQVGTENRTGIPAEGFSPPAISGTGNSTAPPAIISEPDNSIHDAVDVESTYPGGLSAWKRFLIKTFRYPTEAEENHIAGTVLIKFVVDKSGKVSDVQAISGPAELRSEPSE
jgi:protein TonB